MSRVITKHHRFEYTVNDMARSGQEALAYSFARLHCKAADAKQLANWVDIGLFV